MSEASSRAVMVNYATADGTGPNRATSPGDYAEADGTLTLSAGDRTAAFEVHLSNDDLDEVDETFTVSLTGSVHAMLGSPSAIEVTILDTDDSPPLSVSMAFSPSTITQGGISMLSYALENTAAGGATSVALADTLPADVTVAGVPAARTTCTDGTLTAVAGGNTIALTGGALAAGATCTIDVAVTSALAGSYRNALESATSSLGASTVAEVTLTVDAAEAPGFAKAFSPATVDPGGVSRLTFTIDNSVNLIEVGSLAFNDDFPVGMVVADTPNGSNTCGGPSRPRRRRTRLPSPAAALRPGKPARSRWTCVRCGPARWPTGQAI